MEFEYRDWDWNPAGKINLVDYIFDAPLRKDIIARVIRWQRAKSRSGNHSTKTISMVSGTTRKPWAQKETGKARQGSLRSPQFRGGAVVFGPHPRDYEHKLNKKVRALGCVSSICFKFKEGLFSVLNDSNMPFVKTNSFSNWMKARDFKSVLFVIDENNQDDSQKTMSLRKCIQNVPYCNVITVEGLNVLDIVKHKNIICSLSALDKLEKRFERYAHCFGTMNNDESSKLASVEKSEIKSSVKEADSKEVVEKEVIAKGVTNKKIAESKEKAVKKADEKPKKEKKQ